MILSITAILQFVAVLATGSVALLADTIHNVGDAATAVPLWIAFLLARRKPSPRFTYGYGRAEDLAGVAIVLIILISAIVAAYEAIDRLIHPQPIIYLGWVALAGVIGFIGNEAVAVFRIRVGREINSAALIADGYHARTDGLTSLAVVAGAFGVWLGFPVADPIVGLSSASSGSPPRQCSPACSMASNQASRPRFGMPPRTFPPSARCSTCGRAGWVTA